MRKRIFWKSSTTIVWGILRPARRYYSVMSRWDVRTSTIVTQMFMENDITIPPYIAGLMCSAIISDTLMFRSPTCTAVDKLIAEKLASIADIDIEEYAKDMFDPEVI